MTPKCHNSPSRHLLYNNIIQFYNSRAYDTEDALPRLPPQTGSERFLDYGLRGNGEMQFYEASATELDELIDANGAPLLEKNSYSLITCCSAFVFFPSTASASYRSAILST